MLASAVRKYCIIPASSVAVESAFSEANFIQRKERSSLSSKNLRYTLVLKTTKLFISTIVIGNLDKLILSSQSRPQ